MRKVERGISTFNGITRQKKPLGNFVILRAFCNRLSGKQQPISDTTSYFLRISPTIHAVPR